MNPYEITLPTTANAPTFLLSNSSPSKTLGEFAARNVCKSEGTFTRYLIQYKLDGQWITCATRKTFAAAKAKAKAELRGMNYAHETSVIAESDLGFECLRRKTCEQFQLS